MSRSSLLGLLIPFVVGLPFLVGAVVVFAQVAMFVCSASKTEATYVGSVAHSGGSHGGTFLYPRFSFTTQEGQVVTITSTFGATDQPYDDGERVPLLYDPHHLEHAEVDSFQLWLVPIFLAPFGLMFTGIPAIVFVAMRNRRASVLPSRHIGF